MKGIRYHGDGYFHPAGREGIPGKVGKMNLKVIGRN